MENTENYEEVDSLAKNRGFYSPTSESYGGVAGFWTFGPNGTALKKNIEEAWRDLFVVEEGNMEVEAPTIMQEPVFEASGHLEDFDDMLVRCDSCGKEVRADHEIEDNVPGIEDAEGKSPSELENLIEEHEISCPSCGTPLTGLDVIDFNLMFETNIGPGDGNHGYMRPETAQGIFVEFPRLREYARGKLPFGVAQIGRAYRNEISPRKSLVRVREFTQAELEYFIDPEEDEPSLSKVQDVELPLYSREQQNSESGSPVTVTVREAIEEDIIESPWIAYFLGISKKWYESVGVDMDRFRFRQHLSGELAHYASDCWDAEAYAKGDWVEISGFAYRGSYDLKKHHEHSNGNYDIFKEFDDRNVKVPEFNPDMSYIGPKFRLSEDEVVEALHEEAQNNVEQFRENDEITFTVDERDCTVPVEMVGFEMVEKTGEKIFPEVVEPSFGIGRITYVVLEHSYSEDEVSGETRTYLDLPSDIAPTFAGVFPLTDDEYQVKTARELVNRLRSEGLSAKYDESGKIGRKYRRQDEVGTPYCVTVDERTSTDDTVTIRERNSTNQIRVSLDEAVEVLRELKEPNVDFKTVTETVPVSQK